MNLSLTSRKKACTCNEPIEMKERRHNYIPQAFVWHGHCFRVHAVEHCWTELKRSAHKGRLCFLVRCAEGTFELQQNLATNTWHLSRARWSDREKAQ